MEVGISYHLFYSILLLMISKSLSRTICPFDSSRYVSKDYVLAVEDYPFGVLTADIFEGVNGAVPKLKSLILRNDSVHTVFPDTFLSLSKLACLDLSRNKMRSLSGAMFRGLRSLDTLILTDNVVTELEDSDLVSMGKLKVLDLSNNAIESISGAALRGLVHLEELSLEGNRLHTLPPLLFYHTPNLKSLKLRGNELRQLDVSMLSQLVYLDVSQNGISQFPNLPDSVQVLNLTHNQLAQLPIRNGKLLSKLREVYLEGNDWDCACETVDWALSWANKSIVGGIFDVKCGSPEELHGQSLGPALAALDCRLDFSTSSTESGKTPSLMEYIMGKDDEKEGTVTSAEILAFLPPLPSTTESPIMSSTLRSRDFSSDWNTIEDFVQYSDPSTASPPVPTDSYSLNYSIAIREMNATTVKPVESSSSPPSTPQRIPVVPTKVAPKLTTSRNSIRSRLREFLQYAETTTTDSVPSNTSSPTAGSSTIKPSRLSESVADESLESKNLKPKVAESGSENGTEVEMKEGRVGNDAPPVSLLNAITILIALAFGLGLCLIFMLIFMILHKVKVRGSHELSDGKRGEPIHLYGPPMFSVSPLNSDIIMRSTYGRTEGMRVVRERGSEEIDIQQSLHPTPFSYTAHAFHSMEMEREGMEGMEGVNQKRGSSDSESPPQSISLSEDRPLWSHHAPGTSIQI